VIGDWKVIEKHFFTRITLPRFEWRVKINFRPQGQLICPAHLNQDFEL